MKITVSVPDELGNKIKEIAGNKKISLSSLTAEALEYYIKEANREFWGNEVLKLVGKIKIDPNIRKEIENGREEYDDRA